MCPHRPASTRPSSLHECRRDVDGTRRSTYAATTAAETRQTLVVCVLALETVQDMAAWVAA